MECQTEAECSLPRIVLAGRPNVGKSTLFNRICGRRRAITDSRPGSTRDRNLAYASWQGKRFELIDTGGLLLESDDPLLKTATEQARRAIAEADRVLLVVDARAGLLPDDQAIAVQLRRAGKPVVVAVNKSESATAHAAEFAPLGFETLLLISAEHGQGVGDLLDAALDGLETPPEEPPEEALKLALVGRPNVGKSSLLNRLVGDERVVVSPIAGTTRDAVDSLLLWHGRSYRLVDTAGLRRVRQLKQNVDHVSVVQARRSVARADVAVVLLDAAEGLREMDSTIAGYVHEAGRGLVLAVNKWDLAGEHGRRRAAFEREVRERFKFVAFAPLVFVSAHTGYGLSRLLAAVDRVAKACSLRVSTSKVNEVVGRASARVTPKVAHGAQDVSILYAAQVDVRPPTFVLNLNRKAELHFSYRRYLENQLRAAFGFEGAPIVLKVRARRR